MTDKVQMNEYLETIGLNAEIEAVTENYKASLRLYENVRNTPAIRNDIDRLTQEYKNNVTSLRVRLFNLQAKKRTEIAKDLSYIDGELHKNVVALMPDASSIMSFFNAYTAEMKKENKGIYDYMVVCDEPSIPAPVNQELKIETPVKIDPLSISFVGDIDRSVIETWTNWKGVIDKKADESLLEKATEETSVKAFEDLIPAIDQIYISEDKRIVEELKRPSMPFYGVNTDEHSRYEIEQAAASMEVNEDPATNFHVDEESSKTINKVLEVKDTPYALFLVDGDMVNFKELTDTLDDMAGTGKIIVTQRSDRLPMSTAPKDGTIVRLQVSYDENPMGDDNSKLQWTIGMNNMANTEVDEWQFVGWNWQQDRFTDGEGVVTGWLPFF